MPQFYTLLHLILPLVSGVLGGYCLKIRTKEEFLKWLKINRYYAVGVILGIVTYSQYHKVLETCINKYSLWKSDESQFQSLATEKSTALTKIRYPVVYHEKYNMAAGGLEKLHSFDSQKYGKIIEILARSNILTINDVYRPSFPSRSTLLQVHTQKYLAELCESKSLAKIVEIGVLAYIPASLLRWRLLEPMQLATQGTIDGGVLALERGWAINLGGGYHHASATKGGGFCIYADITLCVKNLQKAFPYTVKKAMIIDLDAHQGDGHEMDFLNDSTVSIIDAYNHNIFPGAHSVKPAIKVDIEVTRGDTDDTYLEKLHRLIPDQIEAFKPDFILYNAGTDILVGDRLGGLNISEDGIIKRDEYIFELAREKYKIPILMVLSGGYQEVNAKIIARSIINLGNKFNLWK